MGSTISTFAASSQNGLTRKVLLFSGLASSLLYIAMNIFIARQYPGYDSAYYTVSELSAIGAPTRVLWTRWALLYTLLVMVFGWAIWKSAAASRARRILGILIFIYGALGIAWHFAPMHQRTVLASGGGTISDTVHLALSFVTVVMMTGAIAFGAAALGRSFRRYSIGSLILLLTFGLLTASEAPRVEANEPTPWIGVWERINIAIFLLWMIVLAIILWRRKG